MKKINKVSVVILSIAFIVGITGYVRAATLVDLDTANSFAVLAGAAISDTGVPSTIIGDVGLSPTGGTGITVLSCTDVTGTIYDTNGGYAGGHDANVDCLVMNAALLTTAKADVSVAYNNAKGQTTTSAVTASTTDSFAGTGYTLTPGVYKSGSSMGVPAALTLDGGGDPNAVFIFQAGSTLTTVSGSTISLTNGARASNVFWQVGSSATLGTGSTFEGTIMAAVSITDNGGSTINGRLFADADNNDADSTGAVTLNNTTVSPPATLRVVKTVVNDNGGTSVAADFMLHVKLSGTDVAGSPAAGTGTPGTAYSLAADTYVVSEDSFAGYTATISGDCAANGSITLLAGETKTCTITNDDIAPQLIVNKIVVNDNGGTKVITDFPLFLDGVGVTSGVATTTTVGSHTVSETTDSGYTSVIGGDCAANGSITLALGDVKTCTVTNDDISPAPATLNVIKTVVNNSGGVATASDFTLHVKLSGTDVAGSPAVGTGTPGTAYSLAADTYVVSEDSFAGYTATISGDCAANGSITLLAGETKTCTVTNNDIAPQLTVNKIVVNDNGGTNVISDFLLFLNGVGVTSGVATTTTVGSHTVSETTDSGYTSVIGGDCAANGSITLALGDVKTCTVTNDDISPAPATLNVIKTVVNNSGGVATASDFTLHVKLSGTDVTGSPAAGTATPGTAYSLAAGTYVVSEDSFAAYTAVISGDCAANGSITLLAGETKTCTITNDDIAPAPPAPATLNIVKTVVNNSGGVATASSFDLHVKLNGTDVAGSPASGIGTPGTAYSLVADTYVVSEDAFAGYTAVISGDCSANGSITLLAGETKTCTITNDDIVPAPATLRIVKTVVNNNGGTAVASDFTMNVAGTNVSNLSFVGSATGVDVTLDAGSYEVTEITLPGYLPSSSGGCSGTITAGETKTCIITNDDIVPQLIVNKIVINDDGGTKVIADFPLFINGVSVTSGVATTTIVGSHTVSETTDSGYTSVIGGDCAANGTITLALGDVKTCTITNDDIAPVVVPSPSGGGGGAGSYYVPVPPLIALTKVPSPLALPDSPGTVEYTYTLRNIGKVAVSYITMVGDTCSPITLISGDTDANARLDVNETWIYTCSTTLSKTHTNIVTAIGWANGISATDIANATVVVGVPVVPPLIHVTKVPSPLVLSAGSGKVTYTNKVTNPGTVALSNVHLSDDKCSSVKYISGDTNGDSKLDTAETWTYICSDTLTKTTVNTITASGDANGLTARDFAIVTVVVSAFPNVSNFHNLLDTTAVTAVTAVTIVPKLPNTGHPPSEATPWSIIIPAGILAILTFLYFARRQQIT